MTQPNMPNMPNLPGFDAMANTFEFVKNMWGGAQATSGIPGMTIPTLSLNEINKQIADLKAVESWLNVNMNMLRGTIHALEVQSATIATLNAMGATFGAEMKSHPASSNTPDAPHPAPNTVSGASPADLFTQSTKPATDSNPLHANAAVDASTAWWNALQTQFNQVVSSVMAEESSAKQKKAAPAKSGAKASSVKAKKPLAKSSARTVQNKPAAATKTSTKSLVKKRAPSAKS